MKHVLLAREEDLRHLYRGLFHALDNRGMMQYIATTEAFGHANGHVYEGLVVDGSTTFWIKSVRITLEHAKATIPGEHLQDLTPLVDAWHNMHHPVDVGAVDEPVNIAEAKARPVGQIAAQEIRRLELIALQDDGYRCEWCKRVFVDGEHYPTVEGGSELGDVLLPAVHRNRHRQTFGEGSEMRHTVGEMLRDIAAASPMTDEQKQLAREATTASMRCLEDPKVPPREVTIDPGAPRYYNEVGRLIAVAPWVGWEENEAALYGVEKARELYLERHPELKPRKETVLSQWTGMSNFDRTIDDGFAEALKAAPLEVYGFYSGWNFHGRVFWDRSRFRCEVWRYHEVDCIVNGATLEEIMQNVSDLYGAD